MMRPVYLGEAGKGQLICSSDGELLYLMRRSRSIESMNGLKIWIVFLSMLLINNILLMLFKNSCGICFVLLSTVLGIGSGICAFCFNRQAFEFAIEHSVSFAAVFSTEDEKKETAMTARKLFRLLAAAFLLVLAVAIGCLFLIKDKAAGMSIRYSNSVMWFAAVFLLCEWTPLERLKAIKKINALQSGGYNEN